MAASDYDSAARADDRVTLAAARAIVAQLYAARATVAGSGLVSFAADGQQVTYASPAALDAAILVWERKVALLSGRRRRVSSVRLDRF